MILALTLLLAAAPCDEAKSKTRFETALHDFDSFKDLKLTTSQLKQQLTSLLKRHIELKKDFEDVIALKCPTYSVDSLVMIGSLYEVAGDKIDGLPKSTDPYADEIDSDHARELAHDNFQAAVDKAAELSVFDSYVDLAKAWLAKHPKP